MVKRNQLIGFIENFIGKDLLYRAVQRDEAANGVQILGSEHVEKVALGVSLNEDFLLEAVSAGSNFCICHHGFDPRTYKSRFPLYSQKRLKLIVKNDITVAGYHYVLDAHPQIGNNAVIIEKLGAQIQDALFQEWGFTGVFPKPQKVKDLADKCSQIMERDIFAVYTGPQEVTTIGVVSGAGKPYALEMSEMEAKGVELYISGETTEHLPNKMKESGINYFVCGHYATEVFGIQELGKVIREHFKDQLEVKFIDIPNPI